MSKYIAVAAGLMVVGWAFFPFFFFFPPVSPSVSAPPLLKTPALDVTSVKNLAWTTWKNYLLKAKDHDLPGIKALSHQISSVCADPAQEETCFALMDGVYEIGKTFKQSDFKYEKADARQIITYTDGPERIFLYFTVDAGGNPKVLGLRFCYDTTEDKEGCANLNADTLDNDGDGWWNSVESLFHTQS
ncbi:MAG: hypothetical protein AAB641_00200 [Patescibacteria group bacterium]